LKDFSKRKNIYLLIFSENREVLTEYVFSNVFFQVKKTCHKTKITNDSLAMPKKEVLIDMGE
jgi:hypothetical protein